MLKRAMFAGLALLALATTSGCFGLCGPWYPGKYLGRVFSCNGCSGPAYWSDFRSNPVDVPDPCDCQGNYIGPRVRRSGGAEIYYETTPQPLEAPQDAVPTPVPEKPEKPKKSAHHAHSHGTQPVRYIIVDQ